MAQREVSFQVFRGSKEGNIVKDRTTRIIGPNDASVRLYHSGVCGTDEHFLHSGCVLGHEGVGIVEEVGQQVQRLKKGDRVGFGYVHKVCGQCECCLHGKHSVLKAFLMSVILTGIGRRNGTTLPRRSKIRRSRS